MSFDFKCTLQADGTVWWWGLDTGKTEVVARNDRQRQIAFHIAGHKYWSGRGYQAYAPARFTVCRFEPGGRDENGLEVLKIEFIGNVLDWNARRPWKDPR